MNIFTYHNGVYDKNVCRWNIGILATDESKVIQKHETGIFEEMAVGSSTVDIAECCSRLSLFSDDTRK